MELADLLHADAMELFTQAVPANGDDSDSLFNELFLAVPTTVLSETNQFTAADILSRAKRPQVTTLNPSPPVPSTSTVPHIPDLPFFNQHPLTYQHHNNMTGNSSIPAGFYLHSCNSVVININKNH